LQLASNEENAVLKKILNDLADDELKHYNTFKAMRDKVDTDTAELGVTGVLLTTKNVFETLKEHSGDLSFKNDLMELWKKALNNEEKSEKFYREKSDEVNDATQKDILIKIADEEHKHWLAIDNVIKFLDQPKHWLEDAEWYNIAD
jgi:rubrerythrin